MLILFDFPRIFHWNSGDFYVFYGRDILNTKRDTDMAMPFDLIIQNNASKKEWVIRGLDNVSPSNLYLQFDNFTMPADCPEGEYTYVCIYNERTDVIYEVKDELLKTILHTGEGDIELVHLRPLVGLLKYGTVKADATYRKDTNKDFYIRRKNTNNNG